MADFHTTTSFSNKRVFGKASTKNGKSDAEAAPAGVSPPQPRCPQCASPKVWKDGLRYSLTGDSIQRFLCRNCGQRFSQPGVKFDVSGQAVKLLHSGANLAKKVVINGKFSVEEQINHSSLFRGKDVASHNGQITIVGKSLNSLPHYSSDCQICAIGEAKNLAIVENGESQKTTAISRLDQEATKGKILEFLWQLEKNGRAQGTIKNYNKWFNRCLKNNANLFDPEDVKGHLAKATLKPRTKITIVGMLTVWYRFLKILWEPPKYVPEGEIPFVPMEEELDHLIAAVGKKTATYLQLLKETGALPGELSKLKWIDIDPQQRVIRIKPEKGSLPRILPLSPKVIEMLNNINPKLPDRIFPSADDMRSCFYVQRKRAAKKLGNPRTLQICFRTFRHWKGTTEYHKTKDIFYVKELLGHKDLKSTQVYVHLEQALYVNAPPENYHVRVVKTQEEITQLLESGFEYVLQKDNLAYFRKRK